MMHLAALKTIAGFLNASGGTLVIGVADDGKVLGLAADGFPNEDKMGLHLVNLLRDRVGEMFLPYVHPHWRRKGVNVCWWFAAKGAEARVR
jgi:predicted HTH transcriptional regulator